MNKKYPTRKFWFGYFEQRELICTRFHGKCYWKEIYWANHLYPGCKWEKELSRDEAKNILKEWKESRGKNK